MNSAKYGCPPCRDYQRQQLKITKKGCTRRNCRRPHISFKQESPYITMQRECGEESGPVGTIKWIGRSNIDHPFGRQNLQLVQ